MSYIGKKIAIIGASYLQFPVIKRAKELGLETHVFSWKDGAVGFEYIDAFYPISILEKEDILKICTDIKINGIVSIASDVAVVTVNYIADKLGLTGNNISFTEAQTNKYQMRNYLFDAQLPIPTFEIITDANKIDVEKYTYPIIVKPVDRSGSRGVTKVARPDQLDTALANALKESFSKKVIAEQFIEGVEVSVESISWDGMHTILAVTDKETTGAPNFIETGHHQPSQLSGEIQEKIRQLVPKALDALGIQCGASHSELMITESNEVYIIEIGARMGGDFIGSELTRLSTGYDFVKAVIDVSIGLKPEVFLNNIKCNSGIKYIINSNSDLSQLIRSPLQWPEIIVDAHYFEDLESLSITSSADRYGYIIYKSNKKEVF